MGNLTFGQIEDAALADAAEKLQRLVRDGVRRFTPEVIYIARPVLLTLMIR